MVRKGKAKYWRRFTTNDGCINAAMTGRSCLDDLEMAFLSAPLMRNLQDWSTGWHGRERTDNGRTETSKSGSTKQKKKKKKTYNKTILPGASHCTKVQFVTHGSDPATQDGIFKVIHPELTSSCSADPAAPPPESSQIIQTPTFSLLLFSVCSSSRLAK